MKQVLNQIFNGIGALLICIGFILYMGIASMYTASDVMRLAVCAIATMGCGVFLLWWQV